jgi:hypothetical protein
MCLHENNLPQKKRVSSVYSLKGLWTHLLLVGQGCVYNVVLWKNQFKSLRLSITRNEQYRAVTLSWPILLNIPPPLTLRISKSPRIAKTVWEWVELWVHMKTNPLTWTLVGILRKEQSSTPYTQKTILTKHHTQLATTSLASLYGFPWLSQATSGLLFSKNSSQRNFIQITNLHMWQELY